MKCLLFTYGILKNSGLLVAKDYKIDATMYDLGAFPAITELNSGLKAIGNIIQITMDDIIEFDRIEGCPDLYRRETIETNLGQAFIYIFNRKEFTGEPITKWTDRLESVWA